MYFLLFIILVLIIYVCSFKDSFNQEQVQKVAPVLFFTALVFFILAILFSLLGSK